MVGRKALSAEENFALCLCLLFRNYQEASVSEWSICREVWKSAALSENEVAWEAVFSLVEILDEFKWTCSSYEPHLISAIKSPLAGCNYATLLSVMLHNIPMFTEPEEVEANH